MSTDDVFLSFLPLAHILDRMIEEYFFHKGASVGYYHGVSKSTTLAFPLFSLTSDHSFLLQHDHNVLFFGQDLNALRDDIMELKPTLLVGVPRVYEKIYEGGKIKTLVLVKLIYLLTQITVYDWL